MSVEFDSWNSSTRTHLRLGHHQRPRFDLDLHGLYLSPPSSLDGPSRFHGTLLLRPHPESALSNPRLWCQDSSASCLDQTSRSFLGRERGGKSCLYRTAGNDPQARVRESDSQVCRCRSCVRAERSQCRVPSRETIDYIWTHGIWQDLSYAYFLVPSW